MNTRRRRARRLSRAKSSCIIFHHSIRTRVYTRGRAPGRGRGCAHTQAWVYVQYTHPRGLKTRVDPRVYPACARSCVRRSMQISRRKTRSTAATLYANLASSYRREPCVVCGRYYCCCCCCYSCCYCCCCCYRLDRFFRAIVLTRSVFAQRQKHNPPDAGVSKPGSLSRRRKKGRNREFRFDIIHPVQFILH